MGSFYEHLVVLDSTADDVVEALGAVRALVAASERAVFVFHDEAWSYADLGQSLSAAVAAKVVAFLVHDSDILACTAWVDGECVAEVAVPDPYESFDMERPPEGGGDDEPAGGLDELVEAIAPDGSADAVRRALTGDRDFAEDRHAQLLEALGLPTFAVGWGHKYLLREGAGFEGPPLRAVGG